MARLTRTRPPPPGLSPAAVALWRALLPMCVKLETVRAQDLVAFELLCVALATEREARERLDREGLTTLTAAGGLKPHPCLRVAERARSQALALLARFGLTPSALQAASMWDGGDA